MGVRKLSRSMLDYAHHPENSGRTQASGTPSSRGFSNLRRPPQCPKNRKLIFICVVKNQPRKSGPREAENVRTTCANIVRSRCLNRTVVPTTRRFGRFIRAWFAHWLRIRAQLLFFPQTPTLYGVESSGPCSPFFDTVNEIQQLTRRVPIG